MPGPDFPKPFSDTLDRKITQKIIKKYNIPGIRK
jgi:hypothetical protein